MDLAIESGAKKTRALMIAELVAACCSFGPDEQVVDLLEQWAEWQRGYRVRIGFPTRSCAMQSGGLGSFDEMCDEAQSYRCRAVDACIDDLSVPAQRAAIHRRYLSAVYRMRDYENALADAHVQLARAFRRKGIIA
jgi:hypothetical protein